ncbi:hypothetical protein ZHAS_00008559 [Anopheles sinensis]|uniref:Uncharacterized protein n=1 Tax=Anopheles sinensis TaxID=74873 RepID=A0A084VT07_ANOSI|nr:hypothetical protein ZHAS_00008559 [Anopheles sinensis]
MQSERRSLFRFAQPPHDDDRAASNEGRNSNDVKTLNIVGDLRANRRDVCGNLEPTESCYAGSDETAPLDGEKMANQCCAEVWGYSFCCEPTVGAAGTLAPWHPEDDGDDQGDYDYY